MEANMIGIGSKIVIVNSGTKWDNRTGKVVERNKWFSYGWNVVLDSDGTEVAFWDGEFEVVAQ